MPHDAQSQPLPIELKRQVVYASLLRTTGEAQQLRNRAIDRLVLAALADTDHDSPLKIGQIRTAVSVGGSVEIRSEAIRDGLERLKREGAVDERSIRFKRHYFVTERGEEHIRSVAASGVQLLDTVLERYTHGLPLEIAAETAAAVFRCFLAECFARLGLEMAKTAAGRIERDDLVRMPQVLAAFGAACNGHDLHPAGRESISARCAEFLRSAHPDDERLKLYLTQSYFFTQLLGMRGMPFDPLAEQAFAGAAFYLDTNTLLPWLLQADAAPMFEEMVGVSEQLGIELRATRATLNETRKVAADKEAQLRKIVEKNVPEALMQQVGDQFMDSFMERRARHGVSLDEFFAPFGRLSDLVQKDLGICVVELVEEDMLDACPNRAVIESTIQEEAELIRKRKKSAGTLEHDVAHLAMVEQARNSHAKTWFLTNDRSLIRAANRLARADAPPVCFGLAGFLQTLSPFVTNASAERSLAEVFSSMLSDQVAFTEHTYDMEELVVLADLHEDVLATRDEKLVQAIDLVKARVLQGGAFRADDAQRNALELRKCLASSVNERERAAIGERERLRAAADKSALGLEDERRLRTTAENDAVTLRAQVAKLEDAVRMLEESDSEKSKALGQQHQAVWVASRRDSAWRCALASSVGIGLVLWNTELAGVLNARFPSVAAYWEYLPSTVRLLGLVGIAIPWTMFVRQARWRNEVRITALTVLYSSVYGLLPWVADGWRNVLSDPLVWIALVASILLSQHRTDQV